MPTTVGANEITLRRALNPVDVDTFRDIASACAPLEVRSVSVYWETIFLSGDLCSVASVGYESVGFLTANMSGQDGFLSQIAVLPEHRGRRIAAKLLDRSSLLLSKRGARWLYIPVPEDGEVMRSALDALAKRWSSRTGVEGTTPLGETIIGIRIGQPRTFSESQYSRGRW